MPKRAVKKVNDKITIEGARIIFRNFSGEEGQYNPKGQRNFCVLLDPDLAEQLVADGWNVKYLKPREEGEEPQPYLQVKVMFGKIPPHCILVTSKNKKSLTEDQVGMLDWVEIKNVDLIIRPYNYELRDGTTGVKAYLKSIYVTLVEDELELKYRDVPDADVPDSAVNSLGVEDEDELD